MVDMDDQIKFGKAALRALVSVTMHLLGEDPTPKTLTWWHYNFVIRELGRDVTEELVGTVSAGPVGEPTAPVWLRHNRERRTSGGVFFALAAQRLSRSKWQRTRSLAQKCFEGSQAKAAAA